MGPVHRLPFPIYHSPPLFYIYTTAFTLRPIFSDTAAVAFGVIVRIYVLGSRTDSVTRSPNVIEFELPSKLDCYSFGKLELVENLWNKAVEDRKEIVRTMAYDRDFPDGYTRALNTWDFCATEIKG